MLKKEEHKSRRRCWKREENQFVCLCGNSHKIAEFEFRVNERVFYFPKIPFVVCLGTR